MGSGNPSVELAPLRGSIEFNLDAFEELESSINNLKDNLEDLSSNIEFTSNIDNLVEQFNDLTDRLSDLNEHLTISSNIDNILDQINVLKENLLDMDATIHIESNISQIIEESNNLKDELDDLTEHLTISSNIDNIFDQLSNLKDELSELGGKIDLSIDSSTIMDEISVLKDNLGDIDSTIHITSNIQEILEQAEDLRDALSRSFNVEINSNISNFESKMDALSESIEESQAFTQQEIEFLQSLGATVEELQGHLEGLASSTEGATSEMRSSFDETMSSADELKATLSRLEITLGSLKYMADIKGNLTIEGITSTLGELDELQSEVANVMREVESLDNTFDITGEDFNEITSRGQELSNSIFDLQEKVSGLGERSEVTREETESFGKEMLESGQNALWNGQMISSMMSPIRTVGEEMFELGLKTSSAMTVTKHLFGASSIQVDKWSKNTVNSMGLAQGAALATAEKFGMSARTLGANKKQAALLAEGYTQLAQHINLGTQGNISYETASQACLAAMAGQTYGLKSLGISFSTSKENAEAAALGYHKAYSKLTPVQQATVRLKLAQSELNKQFGTTKQDLQTNYGQWEKTKAQLEKVGETLGEQLVPAVLTMARDVGRLAEKFEHLSTPAKDAVLAIGGLLAIAGPVVEAFGLIKLAIGGAQKAFELFSGIMETDPIILAITALIAAVVLLREAWKHNWGGMRTDVINIWHDIVNDFEWGKNHISTVIKDILEIIVGIANPVVGVVELIREAWKHNFLGIKTDTLNTWKDIKRDFHNSINDIKNSVDNWWNDQKQAWINGYNSLKNSATNWWNTQKNMYKNQLQTIRDTWNKCKTVTIEEWNHITSKVSHALHTILTDIEDTPFAQGVARVTHSIVHLITACKNAVVEISEALVHAVVNRLEGMGREAEQIGENIASRFERLWNRIATDTENAMESIKNAFDRGWSSLCGWFEANVGRPAEYVGQMLERFGSHIESGISEARQVFDNGWSSLCGWFSVNVGHPAEYVGQMLERFGSRIESGIQTATNSFDSGWNALCSWFDGAVEGPVHSVESMGSSFEGTISSVMSSVSSVFESGWSSLCSWFSGAANDIVSTVKNLGSSMWSAGSDIIHDLLSGLANAWGDVTSWISGKINALANSVSNAASHIVGDITSWGNDGSHATGLAYVPWDGYRAELHKGEMVLTAEQAEAYKHGNNGTGGGNTYNFYSPEPIDPFEAKRQMIDASRKLANGFY
ncbi:hypothetical protein [Clostridium massiliamazoniense]|uniref:hypothetical protein n=1 Tax=Clostridium massiliamazoniense TaxID=1347366 RepID=UPI0006D7D4FC|nr:hypothetical protein [Clostridium massiliamazoniense]